MQVPILNGVYTGETADYKISYPINMVPVIQNTGISEGYLRPVDGIVQIGVGPGISRGAINWDNVLYRVMGRKLCSTDRDGTVTIIGDVGTDNKPVTMCYSFDQLAIASNGNLFYYNGTTLSQVTDPDLGLVLSVVYIDGYFMTTDGEFLVVTDLNDPTSINPLKYGSSEIDPDPINNVWVIRNEVYAVNRYTIEVFDNVGGDLFPFQRIDGAQIHRGAIGPRCSVVYEETLMFLGSGRNEAPGIYMGYNTQATKISTKEIDEELAGIPEAELSLAVLEVSNNKGHSFLWVRLQDRTLVFDMTSSKAAGEPIWHEKVSGTLGNAPYRARDVVYCYDKWQVGDTESPKVGVLDNTLSTHFGSKSIWEFGTKIIYNDSMGAIINKLELVALTGRFSTEEEPMVSTSYSVDGRLWSQEKYIKAGMFGERLKRLVWWRQGGMRNMRIQRFRGDSNSYIAISRLEADIEPLNR